MMVMVLLVMLRIEIMIMTTVAGFVRGQVHRLGNIKPAG